MKDGNTVSSAEGKIMEFPLIWFAVDLEGPVGQRYKDPGLWVQGKGGAAQIYFHP